MGMARSRGDLRVLFVMNLVLSAVFCYVALRGLALIDMISFSWELFAGGTIVLMALTYVVTRS